MVKISKEWMLISYIDNAIFLPSKLKHDKVTELDSDWSKRALEVFQWSSKDRLILIFLSKLIFENGEQLK